MRWVKLWNGGIYNEGWKWEGLRIGQFRAETRTGIDDETAGHAWSSYRVWPCIWRGPERDFPTPSRASPEDLQTASDQRVGISSKFCMRGPASREKPILVFPKFVFIPSEIGLNKLLLSGLVKFAPGRSGPKLWRLSAEASLPSYWGPWRLPRRLSRGAALSGCLARQDDLAQGGAWPKKPFLIGGVTLKSIQPGRRNAGQ